MKIRIITAVGLSSLLLVLLLSCNSNAPLDIEKIKLPAPLMQVDNFRDSLYLKGIKIAESNSELFLLDEVMGKIVVSDTDLNYIGTIGMKGRAKNEFINASSFTVLGDTVLVRDSGNKKFIFYNKDGDYLSSYSFLNIPVRYSGRFAFNDNSIFISTVKDSSFIKIDLSQESKFKLIGERFAFANRKQEMIIHFSILKIRL